MGWRRGQAYSQDLRDRVLSAQGTAAAVGERLNVSRSHVAKVRARRAQLGEVSARAQRCQVSAKLAGHDEALRARVRQVPDATLAEMMEWTRTTLDVTVSVRTMWKRLKLLGLTLKKSRSSPRNGRGRMSPGRVMSGTH
jgi:transposase